MTKQELQNKLLENLKFKTWTKGTYAKTEKGNQCGPLSKYAEKWCVAGLACKITRKADLFNISGWNDLSRDFSNKYGMSLVSINDTKGFKELKNKLSDLYKV